jgi:hypothetical protein
MFMKVITLAVLSVAISASASRCFAGETVAYTYDSLGRVISEVITGGDNNGMTVTYSYDPSGNRTEYKVVGAKNVFPFGVKVIVLPLNGFTIVPIP